MTKVIPWSKKKIETFYVPQKTDKGSYNVKVPKETNSFLKALQ